MQSISFVALNGLAIENQGQNKEDKAHLDKDICDSYSSRPNNDFLDLIWTCMVNNNPICPQLWATK